MCFNRRDVMASLLFGAFVLQAILIAPPDACAQMKVNYRSFVCERCHEVVSAHEKSKARCPVCHSYPNMILAERLIDEKGAVVFDSNEFSSSPSYFIQSETAHRDFANKSRPALAPIERSPSRGWRIDAWSSESPRDFSSDREGTDRKWTYRFQSEESARRPFAVNSTRFLFPGCFNPDESILCVQSGDQTLSVYKTASGERSHDIQWSMDILGFTFLKDGRLIVLDQWGFSFIDASTGKVLGIGLRQRYSPPKGSIKAFWVSTDGRKLVVEELSTSRTVRGHALDWYGNEGTLHRYTKTYRPYVVSGLERGSAFNPLQKFPYYDAFGRLIGLLVDRD